jgi:hypothetical protein
MGIALYVMFIGLLVPSCRRSRATLFIALLAIAIHCSLHYIPALAFLSTGLKIVITTIISALVGAIIFPEEANG